MIFTPNMGQQILILESKEVQFGHCITAGDWLELKVLSNTRAVWDKYERETK